MMDAPFHAGRATRLSATDIVPRRAGRSNWGAHQTHQFKIGGEEVRFRRDGRADRKAHDRDFFF